MEPGFLNESLQQTASTSAITGVSFLPISLAVFTILRFIPTLARACVRWSRKDPAGTTYVLAWLALLSGLVNSACLAAQTLYFSQPLAYVVLVAQALGIVCLTGAITVMVNTFLDMVYSFKRKKKFHRMFFISFIVTLCVALACGLLLGLLPTPSGFFILTVGVFCLLIVGSVIAPLELYYKSATNMAKTAGRPEPRFRELARASLIELVLGNRAMRRALGLYGTASLGDEVEEDSSKGSRNSRQVDAPPVSLILARLADSFRVSLTRGPAANQDVVLNKPPPADVIVPDKAKKFFLDPANTANSSHLAHVRRRETALVKFLGRALRANFYLSLCLAGHISLALLLVVNTLASPNEVLYLSLQSSFFFLSVYQVLWLLDHKYKAPHADKSDHTTTPGASKANSKETSLNGSFTEIGGALVTDPSRAGSVVDLSLTVVPSPALDIGTQVALAATRALEARVARQNQPDEEQEEEDYNDPVRVYSEDHG